MVRIDEQPAAEEAGRTLDLTLALEGPPQKSWKKPNRADSQSRDGR
jgi:hypothetical protein